MYLTAHPSLLPAPGCFFALPDSVPAKQQSGQRSVLRRWLHFQGSCQPLHHTVNHSRSWEKWAVCCPQTSTMQEAVHSPPDHQTYSPFHQDSVGFEDSSTAAH